VAQFTHDILTAL